MNEKQLQKIFILFVCGIFLVVIAPYLFTRSIGFVNFKDTGTIGDTIGGITAPITSLLGSILVFYALKAQIEANRLIQFQFDQQRLDEIDRKKLLYLAEQINLVRDDVNDFSYNYKETESLKSGDRQNYYINLKGTDAIAEFVDNIKHYGEGHQDEDPFVINPKLTELYNLLQIINGIIVKIYNEVKNEEDRVYFKSNRLLPQMKSTGQRIPSHVINVASDILVFQIKYLT